MSADNRDEPATERVEVEETSGVAVGAETIPDADPAGVSDTPLTPRQRGRRRRRRDTIPGRPVPRGLRTRVESIVRNAEQRASETASRRLRVPLHALRIGTQVLRQWARDRCPQQAASLAFQTILSIVPLIAVTLAALRMSGSMDAQSSFVDYLAREFLPVSREEISAALVRWSSNITFKSLGLVGLITILFLAFVMINSLEKTINQIWRAERRRSLTQKFVVFYATATIGPFLVASSLYQAEARGLTDGFSGVLFSFASTFALLLLANLFLPTCPVRLKPAAVGAVTSTILFESAKHVFALYATNFAFDKYEGIYGAIAVVPLFLLWIYWSWLGFLLGVEVAHAYQHIHILRRFDRRGNLSMENELVHRVNGVTAARVMVVVAENYIRGDKVTTRASLEDRLDLSDDVIDRVVERLKTRDIVLDVQGDRSGLLPARPPSEIKLLDVLGSFRGDDLTMSAPAEGASKLDKLLRDIEADTRQRTAHITLADLVSK